MLHLQSRGLEGSAIHGERKEGEACPALLSVPPLGALVPLHRGFDGLNDGAGFDPLVPSAIGPVNDREARESGLWLRMWLS
jgi:hypothetical protein